MNLLRHEIQREIHRIRTEAPVEPSGGVAAAALAEPISHQRTVWKQAQVSLEKETTSVKCKFMGAATQKQGWKCDPTGNAGWELKSSPVQVPDHHDFSLKLDEEQQGPPLTCEAGIISFLLEDALGLRVESEPESNGKDRDPSKPQETHRTSV